MSFGEILKPEQQFTEDKYDKVVQMEKIKFILELGIYHPRVYWVEIVHAAKTLSADQCGHGPGLEPIRTGDPIPVAGTAGKSTTLLPSEPEPSPTIQTDFIETMGVGAVSLTILATPKDEDSLASSQRVAVD